MKPKTIEAKAYASEGIAIEAALSELEKEISECSRWVDIYTERGDDRRGLEESHEGLIRRKCVDTIRRHLGLVALPKSVTSCPWCGGEAAKPNVYQFGPSSWFSWIDCAICGCSAPRANATNADDAVAGAMRLWRTRSRVGKGEGK